VQQRAGHNEKVGEEIQKEREMPDIMFDLVKHVVHTKYEDLTDEAIDYAKKSILDMIGVCIAGSTAEGCKEIVDLVKEWGGKEESTIWIFGGKVPATLAGLVIGTMARARDFGDVRDGGGGHISEYVFPPLFPVAERQRQVSGKDFITALALAQDLGLRIVFSMPHIDLARTRIGGFPHVMFGITAGVARLAGLDEDTMMNAMGIAYARGGGDKQAVKDGALTMRVQHGFLLRQ